MLHYKYLGFERLHARHQQYQTRQRTGDIASGWGFHYAWSREQLREEWTKIASQLVDVTAADFDPGANHPGPRWWDKYRRSDRGLNHP
jgi:hypothetical protein